MRGFASWALFLLIFSGLSICCHADEIYDVETLPNLRTKQYPCGPYKKIIVFSAPRTGSSLAYNIFKFLFEAEAQISSHHNDFDQARTVLKTHKFSDLELVEEKDVLYIFTIRNPLNACISNFRICPRKITDNRAFAKELVERHENYLRFSEGMEKNGKNVVRLRYEDFTGNLDHLFDVIEGLFCIPIASEDKGLMGKGYSKQNICLCTQGFADFTGYLPISGFHGLHVNSEGYTPPEEFLYWLGIYLEDVKPLFRGYGYFLDTP